MAVKVNGSNFEAVEKSGFLEIERMWSKGDVVICKPADGASVHSCQG